MTSKKQLITAKTFMEENPLWEVIKLKDGKDTLSYKSNNVLYLLRCKQCGNEAEKPGNTIGQCTRCKYTLRYDDDDKKFVKEEPTDEKDIRVAAENMKKPAKKFTSIEGEVPDKRKKEKVVLVTDESDDDTLVEVDEGTKNVALDLSELIKIASKTTGLKSDTQLANQKKKKDSYAKRREEKIESHKEQKEMEVENIDEFDGDDELTTTTTTILPKKKDKEHSKIVDHNIDEEPCPPVKVEEIMMKVVRLRPGQTYFCKESGILFMVDE
jgi:hypothetical protein